MSKKASDAENQQATRQNFARAKLRRGASETICQSPFAKKKIIAYLNGAIHDATLNKGKRIRFSQKHKDWLEILKKFLKEINCNSWIYKEGKDRDIYVLETLCKELNFNFDVSSLTSREKIAYIRGFFDAEGGIPRKTDRFYIQLVQKDFKKIETIKNLLGNLGIESGKIHNPSRRIDPDYWRIFISVKSYKKFASVINSHHPLKVKIFHERMKI